MDIKITNVLRNIEELEKTWSIESGSSGANDSYNENKTIKFWSVPKTSGDFLNYMVYASKAKVILELGCSAGYSAVYMAAAAKETGAKFYTTEIFKPKIDLAIKHFTEAGLIDNITILEGDIIETIRGWKNGMIDMVFMDAEKIQYINYYKLLWEHLSQGAIIIGDNFIDQKEALQPFLDLVQNDDKVISTVLPMDNGLLMIYKK
ncbi:hypothetical protein BH10BAC5_BH10BAC5_15080 [soil metagenome]